METNTPTPLKLCDLLNNSGRYEHLRIFLTKEKKLPFERDFLLVTNAGFHKVVLKDISYDEPTGSICLVLQDCESGDIENLYLDIQDRNLKCIFVDWRDIRHMVLEEGLSNGAVDDELLDFEFEKSD